MKVKFTKMQGAGNDYIYIDTTKFPIENPEELAVKLSDRRFGIGGDGIILIKKNEGENYFMDIYNADGSRAKMCGNGIRCFAKYLYDHKMISGTTVNIDTLSGTKEVNLELEGRECVGASVDMGMPIIIEAKEVKVIDKTYQGLSVNVGNPHFVIMADPDLCTKVGPQIEWNKEFPQGVNTEFVRIDGPQDVTMRVWERGSGETFACGTGCTAVAAALKRNELYEGDTLRIHCLGGIITIKYSGLGHAYMSGPAVKVFEGEFTLS